MLTGNTNSRGGRSVAYKIHQHRRNLIPGTRESHPGEGEAQSIRLPENYRKNVVAIFHQKIFASLQTLSGDNSESFGKRSPSRLPQPSIKQNGFMVVHASGECSSRIRFLDGGSQPHGSALSLSCPSAIDGFLPAYRNAPREGIESQSPLFVALLC